MSTTAARLSLARARRLADRVAEALSPACERMEIAGSVRRGEPDAGDLEVVAVPAVEAGLFPGQPGESRLFRRLAELVDEGALAYLQGGDRHRRYEMVRSRLCLDLFVVTPETWGVQLALRTGPADFSRALVTPRARGGLLADGLLVREGRVWPADRVVTGMIDYVEGGRRVGRPFFEANGATPLDTPEEAAFFALAGGWVEPHARGFELSVVPPRD